VLLLLQRGVDHESKVFEVPLETLPTVSVGTQNLPVIFQDLLNGVRSHGLETEGIFRVSGNIRKVKVRSSFLLALFFSLPPSLWP